MKTAAFVIGLLGAAAVSLAGCQKHKRSDVIIGGRVLTVSDQLSCPESVGAFSRSAQAGDGQSCDYRGPDEQQLHLLRLPLNGEAAPDRLLKLRTELSPLVPLPVHAGASGEDNTTSRVTEDGGHDQADINLPGLHVHADGDRASVNLPGIHVNAAGDVAHVTTEIGALKNAKIDANDDGVRIEADMTDAANVDMTWYVAGKLAGPDGDHLVGYYARGPKTGPLVIAEIRSKSEHQHGTSSNLLGGDDVHRLVSLSLK